MAALLLLAFAFEEMFSELKASSVGEGRGAKTTPGVRWETSRELAMTELNYFKM